jgi:hypothetical protein
MSDVSAVAAAGDRRATLVALRDRLATAIDECEPKDLAALSRQLVAVTAEIDDLAEPEGGTLADQLAARRAARVADADAADRPRTGRQSRR